ncbi:MAG: hypothetical protein U0V56_12250 [Actinomycetota bacterium]
MRGLPRHLSGRPPRTVALASLTLLLALASSTPGVAGASGAHRASDALVPCPVAAPAAIAGRIALPGIDEVSGVVAGRRTDGLLWIEEDSGNPSRIWGVDRAGNRLASVRVAGAVNLDWEDIALARGRVWIADIGDNLLVRPTIAVYSFPEPSPSVRRVDAAAVTLRYPDGPHNAEALFVDGPRRQLFVVTKEPGVAQVFRTPLPAPSERDLVLRMRPVIRLRLNRVTAADLGPEGIVIKAGSAFLYRWTDDRRVASALAREPCELPAGPGESIAFGRSPDGLIAIPEGRDPPIYITPAEL